MNKSEDIKELIIALNECNKEIKNPKADAINPHYKAKYTKLNTLIEELRPTLQKNGIVVMCDGFYAEQGILKIRALIMHTSGQWIERSIPIPTSSRNRNDAQTFLSALTYGRRGLISAIFNVASEEDDDGNSLIANKVQKKGIGKKGIDKEEVKKKLENMTIQESVKYFNELEKDFVSEKQRELFISIFKEHKEKINQDPAQKIEDAFNGETVSNVKEIQGDIVK